MNSRPSLLSCSFPSSIHQRLSVPPLLLSWLVLTTVFASAFSRNLDNRLSDVSKSGHRQTRDVPRQIDITRELLTNCTFQDEASPADVSVEKRDTCSKCIAISSDLRSRMNAGSWLPDDLERETIIDSGYAYQCIQEVKLDQQDALATLTSVERFLTFHSTLAFLKDPAFTKPNHEVDILAALAELREKVSDGSFQLEIDFERNLKIVMVAGRDDHLDWRCNLMQTPFSWRRPRIFQLTSVSFDGNPPQIFLLADMSNPNPSPVTKINNVPVDHFLRREVNYISSSTNPEIRRDSMLFESSLADPNGRFVHPVFYPGPTTNITLESGAFYEGRNYAVLRQTGQWIQPRNMDQFYNIFVRGNHVGVGAAGLSAGTTDAWRPHSPPARRDSKNFDDLFNRQTVTPIFEGQIPNVQGSFMKGYMIDISPSQQIAVLRISDFRIQSEDQKENLSLVGAFLQLAEKRGITSIIIDLRGNEGGYVGVDYQFFTTFFPTTKPFAARRMRVHPGVVRLAERLDLFRDTVVEGIFDYKYYHDIDDNPFASFDDFWRRPEIVEGDSFTPVFRETFTGYELPDPPRYQHPNGPFDPKNIILFTDGHCASVCASFVEFMTHDVVGAKTVVVSGSPTTEPMSILSDTKGSGALTLSDFKEIWEKNPNMPAEIADLIPSIPPIKTVEAMVNLVDQLRQDHLTTPLQFVLDPADCRLWWTRSMLASELVMWQMVYQAATTGIGCVSPSAGAQQDRA